MINTEDKFSSICDKIKENIMKRLAKESIDWLDYKVGVPESERSITEKKAIGGWGGCLSYKELLACTDKDSDETAKMLSNMLLIKAAAKPLRMLSKFPDEIIDDPFREHLDKQSRENIARTFETFVDLFSECGEECTHALVNPMTAASLEMTEFFEYTESDGAEWTSGLIRTKRFNLEVFIHPVVESHKLIFTCKSPKNYFYINEILIEKSKTTTEEVMQNGMMYDKVAVPADRFDVGLKYECGIDPDLFYVVEMKDMSAINRG